MLMAEFYRSRLQRRKDEDITKKTILMGLSTLLIIVLILVFGLPFLVKFSILLGEAKSRGDKNETEKVLPPLPPRLIIPFEATNSSVININGFAEANTNIELLINDVSMGKTDSNEEGVFKFENLNLEIGENFIMAIAANEIGGKSEASSPISVVYDNKSPEIVMINPVEESLKVDTADFDVIGRSEPEVSVTINNRIAMVDDSGLFKLKFQLNSGKNDIEIIVTDMAGNQVRRKITITYDF